MIKAYTAVARRVMLHYQPDIGSVAATRLTQLVLRGFGIEVTPVWVVRTMNGQRDERLVANAARRCLVDCTVDEVPGIPHLCLMLDLGRAAGARHVHVGWVGPATLRVTAVYERTRGRRHLSDPAWTEWSSLRPVARSIAAAMTVDLRGPHSG